MWIARNSKRLFYILIALLSLGGAFYFVMDESLPAGGEKERADELARKLLEKHNYDAYEKAERLSWTFLGNNYTWKKQLDSVTVSWGNIRVELDLKSKEGVVYKEGVKLNNATELVRSAYSRFCNDSFWVFAHYKLFDNGTTRSLVQLEKGRKGLLVSYNNGGVTPGDSYLWTLDEENRILAWKMWVTILPVGGVKASFEGWEEVKGVTFAESRRIYGYMLDVSYLEVN